jgi:hypothetical protein
VVRTRGLDERFEFLRPVETYRVETLNRSLSMSVENLQSPPVEEMTDCSLLLVSSSASSMDGGCPTSGKRSV